MKVTLYAVSQGGYTALRTALIWSGNEGHLEVVAALMAAGAWQ